MIIEPGIYSIDDMKDFGRDRNWCPYFLARYTVSKKLLESFQYL